MNNDGVALFSTAHPIAPWYRRWWMMLRRPQLSVQSLETREIEILDPPEQGMLQPYLANVLNTSTTMNDKELEQEIQAKGLTAPRVTLKYIEERAIAWEYYITGDQIPAISTAVLGPTHNSLLNADITPLSCLTLCVLMLKNGFMVTGESACASPENFDAAIGRKLARENAVRKIWQLEGY